MSKIIVSKLQNGAGPELTLPTVDGIAGQVLALGVLNDLKFKDVTQVVSTPPTSSTIAVAGDILLNNQSGAIYYCVAVQASPYKAFWLGTDGLSVGFPRGQALFATAPTTSYSATTIDQAFTVPAGVFELSAVLVGAGGGGNPVWANYAGGGGALAWANNIPVTPGESLIMRYQPQGTPRSTNASATTLLRGTSVLFSAQGGRHSATDMSAIAAPVSGSIIPGNINSGRGGLHYNSSGGGGGGGAGGYTGNGGNGFYGSTLSTTNTFNSGINGTGGAGAGGNGYQSSTYGFGGGGGVGLFGEGASGVGRASDNGNSHYNDFNTYPAGGGSGGERGAPQGNTSITDPQCFGASFEGMKTVTGGGTPSGSRTRFHGQGGHFGGGGGGSGTSNSDNTNFCTGGAGGARIIWGRGRAFPNTQTGDVTTEA